MNSRDRRDSLKQDEKSAIYDGTQDLISKKYRETYGTSIVSKSKDKARRRSLRKEEVNSSYDKEQTQFNFNKTIEYGQQKKKSYKIGADLGFDSVNNTIDYANSNTNRPYIRRIIYH